MLLDGITGIDTLGAFTAGTAFSLINTMPLTVTGPLRAPSVAVRATDSLTLQAGRITGDSVTLAFDGTGVGILRQTGTTGIAPLTAAAGALSVALPASGGQVSLNDLAAPAMNLALNLGTGTASGNLNTAGLAVNGSGGSAALFGTVGGQTGVRGGCGVDHLAAVRCRLSAQQLRDRSATCGVIVQPPPVIPPPFIPPPVTLPRPYHRAGAQIASLTPKSFLEIPSAPSSRPTCSSPT